LPEKARICGKNTSRCGQRMALPWIVQHIGGMDALFSLEIFVFSRA
jgi:hypothetical protein